ncbi:MAG: hypothetical protein COY04_01460, partial [Parcubacteria group bacterium CG_4_10_14_0_2_um_filter_7_35_8]
KNILPLSRNNSPIQSQANSLKNLIEKNLTQLNEVEEISDPKVIFNFSDKGFSPQRMILFNNSLYFFSSFQKGIMKLSNDNLEKIDLSQVFSFVVPLYNNLALFTKPDQLSIFDGNQVKQKVSLELLSQNVFISLSSFNDSLYFLEKDTGRVVQYKQPLSENIVQSSYWIKTKEKKPIGAESISVTGLVYILTNDNSIWRYRDGVLNNVIELSVFPFPKNLTKLVYSSSFSGFAILESSQERVILINTQGVLIKQFKSKKFINLKDVVFSQDGKSLYILSGSEVYKFDL